MRRCCRAFYVKRSLHQRSPQFFINLRTYWRHFFCQRTSFLNSSSAAYAFRRDKGFAAAAPALVIHALAKGRGLLRYKINEQIALPAERERLGWDGAKYGVLSPSGRMNDATRGHGFTIESLCGVHNGTVDPRLLFSTLVTFSRTCPLVCYTQMEARERTVIFWLFFERLMQKFNSVINFNSFFYHLHYAMLILI